MYLLFADDIVLFSDTAEGLQKQISLFWGYCRLWQLIVNLPKSKVVIYNKGYVDETYEFKIGEDRLEICESYKYLGLWCSNSPNTFAKNYTYLSQQAKKALYAIKSYTTPSLGKLHPNLALKLFDSLISPILMYGSEILYNGREQNDFEKIHLSYLKNMLGVRRQTPTLAIYGDTGHFPLLLKQQVQTLKYWARLIALPDNHILKNAYNCLLGLDSIGIENWTTHVKTLTFNLNLGSFWETQTMERRCRFINNVKQQTEDKFIDDWTEKISCQNQHTKLRTYNTFSFFPKLATYVSDLTDTRLIAAVARLRLAPTI